MSWRIVIDQRASLGGSRRYGHESNVLLLIDAVQSALIKHGLQEVEEGEYQITATSRPGS